MNGKTHTARMIALTLPDHGFDTFEKDVAAIQQQIDELKIYQQKNKQPHRVEKPRRTRRV
jgi:hypothetical protein